MGRACIYIYICGWRERERARCMHRFIRFHMCLHVPQSQILGALRLTDVSGETYDMFETVGILTVKRRSK